MGSRKRDFDFLFSNSFLRYKDYSLTGEMKKKIYYYTNRTANKTFRQEWIFEKLDEQIKKISLNEIKLQTCSLCSKAPSGSGAMGI